MRLFALIKESDEGKQSPSTADSVCVHVWNENILVDIE